MPQDEIVPNSYSADVSSSSDTLIQLQATESLISVKLTFEALKPGLYRTTFTSDRHPLPPFPSARPYSKTNAAAFSNHLLPISSKDRSRTFVCSEDDTEAKIDWTGVPIISIGFSGKEPLHTDLPFRSYVLDGNGIAHYTRYHRESLHVGLGEKPAPWDLSSRHFTLSATDCFGYDTHRTDPMYKHIPLLIRATPDGVVATFSTSHARGYYSVGSEMDGMWGRFKVYRQEYGGLEQYLLIGKTLQEVISLYADLVGYPMLVPRWAFGYLAGGMRYSMLDSPRACDALMEFAQKLEQYDIPCSGFQMSSGYTVAETEPKTRNVFTWNRHRFPDPKAFCDAFHARGIRLLANIKPYILASHPKYQSLVDSGALFTDPKTGKSAVCRLWSAGGGESGEGGHIDFTSRSGFEFWYDGVKELRRVGIDCMWNDNNEFTIPSDDWAMALSHESCKVNDRASVTQRNDVGLWGRAMHCELMGKASHDALLEVYPEERPFVLTRSGTAGTFKYACSSWSGDNVTSWADMQGANAISLTASVSLMHCYGHDIGGFEGPQPSPELLLRWIQLGIHSPRFAINCFKTGDDNSVGDVIEPWMYPEIIPEIRSAIQRRYELIPYLYSLMLESHLYATPPQRWTGMGYETDPEVWSSRVLKDGEIQYWLGSTLLVGGVYEPGADEAKMYLPKKTNHDPGYLNLNSPYQHFPAGRWFKIAAPWKASIPVVARIGGLVVIGKNRQVAAPGDTVNEAHLMPDDWRGMEIFPPLKEQTDFDGVEFTNVWMEDDGVSPPPVKIATFTLTYKVVNNAILVRLMSDLDGFVPPWIQKGVTVILPVGDLRSVVAMDGTSVQPTREHADGRRRFHFG